MPRQKIEFECHGDSDAENLLVKCDKDDRQIARAVADLEVAEEGVNKRKGKIKEMQRRREARVAGMENYFLTRRDSDFSGDKDSRRQRSFKGGTVGFRKSPPVLVTIGKFTWAKAVEMVKGLLRSDAEWKKVKKDQVIKTSEALKKDEIKALELPAESLAKAGLAIEEPDMFWVETDFERDMKVSKGEKAA